MTSTSVDVFLDTNVLVYYVSEDPNERAKALVAQQIVLNANYGVSAQVLQEFFVTVTRKGKKPMSVTEARAYVLRFSERPTVALDDKLVVEAIDIMQRFQTSYWDAAILAAAQRLGAKTLLTEDLSHGQHYGSVRVLNPFREREKQATPA